MLQEVTDEYHPGCYDDRGKQSKPSIGDSSKVLPPSQRIRRWVINLLLPRFSLFQCKSHTSTQGLVINNNVGESQNER